MIPAGVIDRPPSAELRENQTDQDSLPPYDVLDAILERFIDDEQSQAEIVAAGFDEATVRRVARLVLVERIQAPPISAGTENYDACIRTRSALSDQVRLALTTLALIRRGLINCGTAPSRPHQCPCGGKWPVKNG